MGRREDRLFLRYLETSDPEALGRVFDRVAPKLLAMAVHLTGDPARAEDLLQTTFLTAIERASSFDRDKPLVPWLIGILSRHAVRMRDKEARSPDPDRLDRDGSPDPSVAAENAELVDVLRKKMEQLPEKYRQPLVLKLVHGMQAAEIAEALGVAPGTLRMRLHRGLERLRRLVPIALVSTLPLRGLAALRRTVLQRAAVSTAAVATLGVFSMKKMLVVGSLAGLALLVCWQVTERPSVEPPVQKGGAGVMPLTGESSAEQLQESGGPDRVPVATAAGAQLSESARDPLRGVVVNRNGEPIAGAEVELLHIPGLGFSTALDPEMNDPETFSRAQTDSDGTFSFAVSRVRSFTLQARAEGYAPELALSCSAGQYRTIVMDEGAAIEGFVTLGEDERPVPDARIVVYRQNGMSDNPMAVSLTVAAEVSTEGSGHYRIAQLAAEEHRISVFSSEGKDPKQRIIRLEPGEVRRLDFTVERGSPVVGTVRDALTGQPVSGASVSRTFFFRTPVLTDGAGRFEIFGAHRALYVRAGG